jgi:hypothetical protein
MAIGQEVKLMTTRSQNSARLRNCTNKKLRQECSSKVVIIVFMETNNQQKVSFFYQSAIVNWIKVDMANPLHVQLCDLFEPLDPKWPNSSRVCCEENVKQATKLMKKIEGFKPSRSLTNTVAWSSDLFIVLRPADWI